MRRKTFKRRSNKRYRNKTRKWKNVRCSAGTRKLPYSCYSSRMIHRMKKFWNARHPDMAIRTNKTKEIWNSLKQRLEPTCESEKCWMKQHFMSGGVNTEMKDFTFAPEVPTEWKKNPDEWLSSMDILRVMKQYEYEYPCFEFMGPSPIDFDTKKMYGQCVWDEICNFNLKEQLDKGKRKIGIIFNLDPHYKPGSHWVALFIYITKQDMENVQRNNTVKSSNKNGIYYFDSYGDRAEPEILDFMERVKKQAQQLGLKVPILENSRRHQYSDSECGMFSLYFIIRMLLANGDRNAANSQQIFNNLSVRNKIPDKHMKELRKMYFNWEE